MTDSTQGLSLKELGVITAIGKDAKSFLQGQLTCDLDTLGEGQASLGAVCNIKGRMVASFWILAVENGYWLILPNSMIHITLEHLKPYSVFSKIELKPAPEHKVFGIIGKPDNDKGELFTCDNDRFILITTTDYLITNPIDQNAWNQLDIEQGLALIQPELSEKFIPQMLNYQMLGGLSFDKGCYLGQEIVARSEFRGKLKRHIHQFTLTSKTVPKIGMDIFSGNEVVGMIVQCALIKSAQYSVLAVLQDQVSKQSLALTPQ
ncbi:MAG: hypothetical protein K0U12_07595 [Gammaproteobacteria bacterium]|nr:hypothetical protein [Gammaproteobacteria bacterium]